MTNSIRQKAPYQDGAFHRISKIVGFSDADFLDIAEWIPPWPDGMSLLRKILSESGKSNSLLFCLDDYVVLQYGQHISISDAPLFNMRTNQKIVGKNEIVDPSASLNEANLRQIFVMIEALVFKCVHLKLEQQSSKYSERTQTYETRLQRLQEAEIIDKATKQLAEEIYQVRCQFAHSLRSIENLVYLSKSLRERWGSTNSSVAIRLKRQFLPDAYQLTEALLSVFKKVQSEQLDSDVFKAAVMNIRKS